jgi:ClpP class serine protease
MSASSRLRRALPTDVGRAPRPRRASQILTLFKGFVATNRPTLDIDKVATGETWFGPDALANGLVDDLQTVDEVLLARVDSGAEVFSVAYEGEKKSPLLASLGVGSSGSLDGLLSRAGIAPTGWRAIAAALLARLAAPQRASSALGGAAEWGSVAEALSQLGDAPRADATAKVQSEVLASRMREPGTRPASVAHASHRNCQSRAPSRLPCPPSASSLLPSSSLVQPFSLGR